MPQPGANSSTRGGLVPAVVQDLVTGEEVYCMFNPSEYTLTKRNNWEAGPAKGKNVPKLKFSQAGAETLKLQLFFDTYAEKTDVREHTRGLWKMMQISTEKTNQKNQKGEPPHVAFRWGKFEFEAVITDISQEFTLFLDDGTPVRTTVDVTFQQVVDKQAHHGQNPTSGGGPPMRTHIVRAGERLDLIAYKVYEDATRWRAIAQANGIVNPLRLREGQLLIIPPLD
mgnify:CR=1 FL=1